MTTDFILPDIGEGIVECEIIEWLVAEGDFIEEDQPVAEVMTDKATVQIPAVHAGTVTKLYYAVGDHAKVHAPLFAMQQSNDETNEQSAPAVSSLVSSPTAVSSPTVTSTAPSDNSNIGSNAVINSGSNSTGLEDFLLPDIGEGIVECEIVKWCVSEGDAVVEDQTIVEVMTDKAVVEIPAKDHGIVSKLYYQQGDIAKVHQPLFQIQKDDNSAVSPSTNASTNVSNEVRNKVFDEARQDELAKLTDLPIASTVASEGQYEPELVVAGKVMASPAVRRMARQHNIDLSTIAGSGNKGRILKRDIAALISQHCNVAKSESSAPTNESQPSNQPQRLDDIYSHRETLNGMQAAMAKHMVHSVSTIPHFSVSDELNLGALMALRETLKPAFAKREVKLSYMPFFIKALSLALNEFPILNSHFHDDKNEIGYLNGHNIGFAVDTERGLIVPNIKNVQQLSLLEIAIEMQRLIELAQQGKLSKQDLSGGSITISNVGVIGGITATPVINKPEVAIVAMGKLQTLPRFDDNGEVTQQHILTVNWSADHRIIDGATMVRFNNYWCDLLARPQSMLMVMK